jgi:hypothetical protein|tara:strand:- start:129101 stop:129352 length:252 start_codon:yes stop_codon:yes gene_type:complete
MRWFKNILLVADSINPSPEVFQNTLELTQRNKAQLTALIALESLPSYLNRLTPHNFRKLRVDAIEDVLKNLKKMGRKQTLKFL